MPRLTPTPSHDVSSIVPEVSSCSKTTVRLHPQPGNVRDVAGSKIGGQFLWPNEEAWPICRDKTHPESEQPPFVAVLQLHKSEVPELGFPVGTDLFQLLWCPDGDHPDHDYIPIPLTFWRNSSEVGDRCDNPIPRHCEDDYVPEPCRVTAERVTEYPDIGSLIGSLGGDFLERLEEQDLGGVYQFELSTCPGTKVGGYPGWVQDPYEVKCDRGHAMEFLLQMTDSEYTNTDTYQRWIPEEDRWIAKSQSQDAKKVNNPANFMFGHSVFYLFICRECLDLPVRMISQR